MQTIESLELAKLETTPQPAQIEAWVQLAQKKNELTQKLANSELALQKILLDCNVNDYKTIDVVIRYLLQIRHHLHLYEIISWHENYTYLHHHN